MTVKACPEALPSRPPQRRRRARAVLLAALVGAVALTAQTAAAAPFEPGALIIPMDTDYQDMGMLEAYGLVYELLRNDITVHWVIRDGKLYGEADFDASGVDHQTNEAVVNHGYRGGPFVIAAADSDAALPVIDAWQDQNPNTTVHEAMTAFDGDVAYTLVVAPTIAMMADGNQKIAREYMLAAKIPDSEGNPGWPDASPDMLDPDELMGPTDTNHRDGALFDEDGDPVYCQFMSMHWGVNDAKDNPEAVAEVREFLQHPTHFFAECQAVNAFENLDPYGYFLTPNGFLIGDKPDAYDFFNQDTAFVQLDGEFLSVGGSEPAYTLPPGDMYKAQDIVMITEQGTPPGVNDVWMTGFIDGVCPEDAACLSAGKVSYLGGHEYKTDLPISQNPDTNGTRLFLNSLFEAPCATPDGLPIIEVSKDGPSYTPGPEVTYTIEYINGGPTTALAASLSDALPAGASFVSATAGGQLMGDTVTWSLGNLGVGEGGSVDVTVTLPAFGTYENTALLEYKVGVNDFELASNEVVTLYDDEPPGTDTDGTSDTSDSSDSSYTSDSDPSTTGSSATDSGSDTGPTATDSSDGTTAGPGSDAGGSDAGTGDADTDSDSDGVGEADPGGCGCRGAGDERAAGLGLLLLTLLVRRRSSRAR